MTKSPKPMPTEPVHPLESYTAGPFPWRRMLLMLLFMVPGLVAILVVVL